MKTFIFAILFLVIAISAGVFGFKYIQNKAKEGQTPITLQRTLTGVLTPVPSTGEYSHVVDVNGQLVGVTSNTVDLKPYENRKVNIVGEYSGATMYADSVTIIP